ncbi:MAG: PDDEXK nuclease domain-containing protein, partial [Cyclobacteriaceae bacterium]|nr:PDDEXK nuclease domain-containing protein [Cyclobacteriaceae bacterium]
KKDSLVKSSLVNDVVYIVNQSRRFAYQSVNFSMVIAYWKVGQRIVEEEQRGSNRARYGQELLTKLASKLSQKLGKGYTESNLRYMRQFYLAFPIHHAVRDKSASTGKISIHHAVRDESTNWLAEISKVIRPELTWTHYRLLLKVEEKEARHYYMNESANQNWSTRSLERQIDTFTYERILSSQNKKKIKAEADKKTIPFDELDFVKDPYILEFLKVKPNIDLFESKLEKLIIDNIQNFLLELGKGFSYVARQKRISAENEHFYVDLVFYNYILKCFVLIDLKIGKLTHQDIGQMDLYVRFFEEEIKQPTDNPTLGIILCSEKNETIVKYSVLKENKRLFASKYKLYLPTEAELKKELRSEIKKYKKTIRLSHSR